MNKIQYYIMFIILLAILFIQLVLKTKICENSDNETKKQQNKASVVLPSTVNNNSFTYIDAYDFRDLDTLFYTHLQNCNPVIIDTHTGMSYKIFGLRKNGICPFERKIDSHTTRCNLPMNIAKQYSKEGLGIMRKLEENIKQNKNIYSDKELQSSYINKIDSDSQYCNPPMGSLSTLDEPVTIKDIENNLPKK